MNSEKTKSKKTLSGYSRIYQTPNLPPGYKHNEAGVIPEDWRSPKIGHLAKVLRGASPRPIDSPIWFDSESDTGWLRISDVTAAGKYLERTTQNLSPSGIANSRFIKSGSLVMSICATVGRPIITKKKVCIHDGFVVFGYLRADKEYLYYLLSSIEKEWSRHGQTGSQMNLNTTLINSTTVPLPPLPEQRAIAGVLSDVDGLLGALEALIAKKRAIKQAAMQQLLIGKTRLPGFEGKWKPKRLGDLLTQIVGGGTPSRSNPAFWGDEIPWVTVKDFASFDPRKTQESISRYGLDNSATHLIPAGTLITSTRMALGKAVIYEVAVCINQDLKALFCQSNLSKQYLYYWFEHNADFIDELGGGSTVKGLAVADLKAISFALPSLPEQTAIATVLSDMDAEIAALEQRRDKTRDIKQGMMQQLLTGKVRLVNIEGAADV